MNLTQKFLITGGTGNQGGAICRRLLAEGHKVMALSRNPESQAAKELTKLGAQVISADLNSPDTYRDLLVGVDGVFSVQAFNKDTQQEVMQGISLADECKAAEVPHLLYSSVAGADQKTGIPHFESKYKIESHIESCGVPYSIIRPTSFCENMLNPRVKNSILKGKLIMPLNRETVQQYVSMHDIGVIGAQILTHPQQFQNQVLTVASDQMTMGELATAFEETLNRKVKYQKLPGLITRLAMGKDLTKMFKWMDQNEFTFAENISALKEQFPELADVRTWIKENFLSDETQH